MKKKIFYELMTVLIFLSLTGCAKKENENKNNYSVSIDVETNKEPEKGKIEKENVDLNSFKTALNNIKSTYNYPEYYMTIEQAEKLLEDADSTKQCNKDENITYNDIYNLLYNNAKQRGNSFNYVKNKYENIDLNAILFKAVYGSFRDETNIYEDYCMLEDVTLIIEDRCNDEIDGYSTTGQYFYDDKIIKLYYETIIECYNSEKERALENNELYLYESLEDYFVSVLQHELNHVRQWTCDCRKEAGQTIETLRVFGTYLIEASAESQLCYDRVISRGNIDFDEFDFSYIGERESQAYMMLYGLLKDNFSHDTFNSAIFNTNLKQFLEIYDIKTPEELVEFYNISYTFETLNDRSSLAEYLITNYKPTVGDYQKMVGYTHKVYIFKNNIKDLMEKVYNEEIGLEESVYLYQFFKAYAVRDSYDLVKDENDNYKHIYDNDFIEDILYLENIYNKFLADAFNYNLDEIKEYVKRDYFQFAYTTLSSYENITDKLSWDWNNFYDHYIVVENILEKYPEIKEISFHHSHLGGTISIFEEEAEKYDLVNSLVRDKKY